MDARQADLLRKIDPAELGHRLRAARVAKGMTQTDLAGADVSVGYVSRIESGHRRPNLQVLTDLCVRLGTPVEQLLMGVAPQELEQIKLTLDFAELSLESGQAQAAEAQAREALEQAEARLAQGARLPSSLPASPAHSRPRASSTTPSSSSRPCSSPRVGSVMQIKVGIALSRCYRESGDFSKAVEVGEMILEQLADTPLDSSDEAVQMAVTLAAAYFERGDTGQAVRVCRKAVTKAEKLESPKARASAYWNASIMEARPGRRPRRDPAGRARPGSCWPRGRTPATSAGLRTQLGIMQLRMDPPQIDEAQEHLAPGRRGVRVVQRRARSTSPATSSPRRGRTTWRAMSTRLRSMSAQCPRLGAGTCHRSWRPTPRRSKDRRLRRQERSKQAVVPTARQCSCSTSIGSDREAAQLWFELAGLLEDVGDFDAARDAYKAPPLRRVLQSRPTVRGNQQV